MRTPTLTALAAALGTFGAQAQTQTTTDATTLPTVTVRASADASAEGLKAPYAGGQVARGGRVGILGGLDVMETPFSLTSYTQKLVQDQQAQSIGDVLRNDPGVRVARGFGNYQQVYIVRGLPVFSDDVAYNGLYGLLPRQYLAAEVVERVEVLRGASAFLNGAAPGGSGLGGAINISPKRATNEPLNEVTLGVDSGGNGYAAADVARRFGDDKALGVRMNLVRRDGNTEVNDERRELSLGLVGIDWRRGGLRVSADLGWQDHQLRASQPNVTIAAGLPIPDAPKASRSLSQPWAYSRERDTFGTLRAEYDLAQDWTAWGAFGMRHGDENTDLWNPTVTNTAGDMRSTRFVGSREDKVRTGEIGVRGKFRTGDIGHTVVASAATYRAKSEAPYAFSDFGPDFLGTITSNLYAPFPSAPAPATALTGVTPSDVKTRSVAVSDTLSFLQDRLLLTLGARHQTIEDGPYDESKVTPVGGIVWKVSPMLSVYGSYVEGLVKGDTAPAVGGGNVPIVNAGEVFKPYATKQVELGAKIDTGRFGATIAVFQSRKPNYAVDPAFVFGEAEPQKNRGIDLTVFGEPVAGVRLLGGATFLRARVGDSDAIGAPKATVNLGAEYDVPGLTGFTVEGRVTHTAKQYADAANTQVVPAWTILDLGARYVMDIGNQTLTLRARVDNVANRDYWQSAGGFPGSGYLVLGAPRTFTVSGTLSF